MFLLRIVKYSVAESITISNTEETVTESRKDSIAKEESALEKTSRRRAIIKTVVWKTFKSIVFLICLIFLIIQSLEFFNIYYKYPTNVVLETTVAKEFKQPAITLCFRTTISFKDFCLYEPGQCEEPRNMEEFCKNHRFLCRENTRNISTDNTSNISSEVISLKIPKQNEWTRWIMLRYLFNDSYNDEDMFWDYKYGSSSCNLFQ
ncbi:hypothetical protein AVEN_99991-1 [Araneus ventricosus]|uniref:Uncharacterized protein n=1 Tax=Araneus ventricosus TaxID=182803 RepID=A0A4Y2JVB9_ARAVE|nr:hypothetical protein AVEN_99991-1 [Araneus ventricosus]